MPSAGAVRLRVAISTRASARRCADVAGQLVEARRPAQALPGLGAVGLEELVLQAVQLARDDGARDRVERHLAEPHPREARLEVDVARRLALLVGGVGAVGVGQLLPVAQRPVEVLEAHRRRPGRRASPRPGPWRPRCGGAGPRRWPGPGRPRSGPPARPRPQRGRWRSVLPEAHPAPGRAAGDPAAGGDPRRRRLGPVGRPLLARLEGGGRLGDEGLERERAGWSSSMDAPSP